MLRVKNLDQKDFFEISNNLKRRIHTYFPEWTDENYHDPGITILEMLVWLEDMQRYYLNRVTQKNYQRFFKLLGQESIENSFASTHLTFYKEDDELVLPVGSKTYAGNRCFETDTDLNIVSAKVQVFISTDDKLIYNYSYACGNSISFYPFGKHVINENKFFIGITKELTQGRSLSMYIDVEDDYDVEKNSGSTKGIGHEIHWEVYNEQGKWSPLELISDKTYDFSESGVIQFRNNEAMAKSKLFQDNPSMYWIRGNICHKGDAVAPKIRDCILNVATANNTDTQSMIDQVLIDESGFGSVKGSYLSINGKHKIQRFIEDGLWENIDESEYEIIFNKSKNTIDVQLKNKRKGTYRLISKVADFYAKVGSGNGLPNQCFHHKFEKVVLEDLVIAVEYQDVKEGKKFIRDYTYTHDFIALNSNSYCFECDLEASFIRFGNDEQGNIPASGEDNIEIISYRISNFEEGNVHIGEIDRIKNDLQISVVNEYPATGGTKKLDFKDKKIHLQKSVKKINRAVTLDDYESITKEIPGLRLRKVKVIDQHLGQNQISVIVIPYLEEDIEKVDQKLLDAIRKALDQYRLLGTQLDVIGPQIVEIELEVGVTVSKDALFKKNLVEEALINKYSISSMENSIGKGLNKNEIFNFLSNFASIHKVDFMWIDSISRNVSKDKSGNIIIPPNGIIKISNCKITVSN